MSAWPFPLPAIDLYAEYMVLHNTEMVRKADGDSKLPGPSLIKACQRYGVTGMDAGLQGGHAVAGLLPRPITRRKRSRRLQDYCLEETAG